MPTKETVTKGACAMRASRSWRLVFSVMLSVAMSVAWVPAASAGPKSVGEEVRLQLFAVNDFHGQLEEYPTTPPALKVGGAAQLAGYMDVREQEAKEASNTITWRLGVGDLIGASPMASAFLQDEPTMQVFDEMGFDFSTVGNHEFDEGIDELLRLQYGGFSSVTGHWEGTHMQYLASNVEYQDTDATVFPPYSIKYARGIPVGIIGAGYEKTPEIVTASGVAGLEFLAEAASVNKCVAELKAKGVEAIVVLLHDGGAGNTSGGAISGSVVPVIEAMDDEVDVVFTAHSHNRYWGHIDGKLVTQGHSAGRAFVDVDLVLDRETGDVASKKAEVVVVDRTKGVPENAKVAQIVNAAVAKVAPIADVVVGEATAAFTRLQNPAGEATLGNLVADAHRWKQNTQIAVTNPGGLRADLPAGPITKGDLFAVQPFSNYLVTMKMTGAQLDTMLEQQWINQNPARMLQISGITYSWSSSEPTGTKVDAASIKVGGVAVDPAGVYTVTANNFLAEGGDGFSIFKSATDKLYWGVDFDALVDYVTQLPQPISPSIEGRMTVLP